jgi:splicing factor U2AF subunit
VKCVSFLKFNDFVLLLFQYGEIEEMNVCDNLGDHLVGNVYIKVSLLSV